ncbi:MAG: hypothetical protein IT456_00800 [Planctomycetes bacterium]|nr:hypothetical protein [Planctomycetota bacterium]
MTAARTLLCWLLPLLGTLLVRAQGLPWDVPQRGAIVFTRTTEAFSVLPPPSRMRPDWVIKPASQDGHEWRYFAAPKDRQPPGFEQPGFADDGWLLGRGMFAPAAEKRANFRTEWRNEELCVRTHVDLGSRKPKALLLHIDHDDHVTVWLNGTQIVQDLRYGAGSQYIIMGDGLDAWQRGDNVLAARCTNTGGAQMFDLSMAVLQTLPPGVRTAEDLHRVLREERELCDRVHGELFAGFRPPPMLLQGELEANGCSVRMPPGDLRELGWYLAMDLRCGVQGATFSQDASRILRLGDLQVKARATAVDAEGWQTVEATVKSLAEPALRDDSKRFVERFVRPHVWYGFDGKLLVRRRIEVRGDKALVAEFTTDLQGRFLRGKDWKEHAASLLQRETWKFAYMRDNQDAAFRAMVQKALEKGTARLREQMKDIGSPELRADPEGAERSYQSGHLALALLALVKGGVPKDDEIVQRGYAELRKRTLVDTYTLGNAIMAIEALYAPPSEFGDLKMGTIDQPRKRTPSPEDKLVLQKWTDRLLTNIDTRVDPAYMFRFHYVSAPDFDHSVNQYGLLGLYSARLCGIEISPQIWEAAANHLLAAQSPGGSRFTLDLVDYRTHARRQASPDEKWTVSRLPARTSGWNYKDPKSDGELSPVWGSMTCSGITGLAICQAALQDAPGMKRVRLQTDASRARNDGFAWIAQNFTVRYHPGAIERHHAWFYYYLYGLERAALLSGVALIQDRDWYFEGSMMLVLAQQEDGNWPVERIRFGDDRLSDDNAMAILFLKQSTMPVLTGR